MVGKAGNKRDGRYAPELPASCPTGCQTVKDIETFNYRMELFREVMEGAPLNLLKTAEWEISFVLIRVPFIITLLTGTNLSNFPGNKKGCKSLLPPFFSGVNLLTGYIGSGISTGSATHQKLKKAHEQFLLVEQLERKFYGACLVANL